MTPAECEIRRFICDLFQDMPIPPRLKAAKVTRSMCHKFRFALCKHNTVAELLLACCTPTTYCTPRRIDLREAAHYARYPFVYCHQGDACRVPWCRALFLSYCEDINFKDAMVLLDDMLLYAGVR